MVSATRIGHELCSNDQLCGYRGFLEAGNQIDNGGADSDCTSCQAFGVAVSQRRAMGQTPTYLAC